MNSKERMLKAWNFEEPDRVPIEIYLYPPAAGLPGADKIREFQDNEADNFRGVPGFDWGFMGIDSIYSEEVIEDVPGDFRRLLRTQTTSAGDFTAITRHLYDEMDPNDYHWEKRYIETVNDFRRITDAKRTIRSFDLEQYNKGCQNIGDRGLACMGLLHPLGVLVRQSNMEEVYMWMLAEEELTLKFLERCNKQVSDSILSIADLPLMDNPVFMTYALEMLIPPWMGKSLFEKFVFPFDKQVNDVIHTIGGRHRAHCHGNCGGFLDRFADMGIDSVEPLEPPPYGNNILTEAKQSVGKRMLLSGNIATQPFCLDSFAIEDVRNLVQAAIEDGAPGGGFILSTTGGAVGNGKTREQSIKDIDCNLALIDAWREFCLY